MNLKMNFLRWSLIAGISLVGPALFGGVGDSPASSSRIVLFPLRKAVLSTNVESVVARHCGQEGEAVKENAPLAELDDRVYQQRLERAEAAVTAATLEAAHAEKNLKRAEDLFQRGTIGQDMLDRARFDKDDAGIKLKIAQVERKAAEINLASCRISVPFAGRIVKWAVQEHEYVRPGQPVCEVIDDSRLLAIVHLPSSEVPSLRKGMKRSIKIDETGSLHTGVIYEIASVIDPVSRTIEVKFIIDNADRKLNAGMSGAIDYAR